MTTLKQPISGSVNKICTTIISGAVASILVLGNNSNVIDMSYNNSTQIVSKDNDRTNIYKTFTTTHCIAFNMPGYSIYETGDSGVNTVVFSDEKVENFKKLETIASLGENWNGNGAKSFNASLIAKVRNIITCLDIQPEIFPTACDSLQLEYDKADGSHMEIEVGESEITEVFVVDSEGKERLFETQTTINAINKVVTEFYG